MTESSQTKPRKGRRRDPEATRKAILDAAEDLFITHGLDATPTSRIARKAGVTKSLIHHHYGSKEELWEAIKKRHFGQYYEIQKQMLTTSGGAELLRQSVITYFRFLQNHPNSVRFMSWRFVEAEDPCLHQENELFELGVDRIREAQETGELRSDVDPLSMIKAFLSMSLNWFQTKPLFRQMLDSKEAADAFEEQYLEDIVRIFMDGIRAKPNSSESSPAEDEIHE